MEGTLWRDMFEPIVEYIDYATAADGDDAAICQIISDTCYRASSHA